MSDNSVPSTPRKATLGDRIRQVADQLRQENGVQIKATARILGAAAQIAENHDQLINEVVEMVEEDLDQSAHTALPEMASGLYTVKLYTVEQLQGQFKTLKDAKAHFSVKANGWDALVSKLNGQEANPQAKVSTQDFGSQRLEAIESEIQAMRNDMRQVLKLLNLLVEKLP